MSKVGFITRWRNLHDPSGTPENIIWDTFFDDLSRCVRFEGAEQHPGWSPAMFSPCQRAKENVRQVHALCLDYDAGETIESGQDKWGEYYGLLHTTRKHTLSAHRFRVVLPFARPVSPFEYDAIWRRIAAKAGSIDRAPRDASRFWYLPGVADLAVGSEYVARRLQGRLLSPDEWLAKPEPVEPRKALERVSGEGAAVDVERRAVAYLATMPGAISGQGGHQATWNAAFSLAKRFGLGEADTYRILANEFNPRCEPPWSEKELRHKASQAQQANAETGFLIGEDRQPAQAAPRHLKIVEPPAEEAEPVELEQSAVQKYGLLSVVDLMQLVVTELQKPRPQAGARTGHAELDNAIGGFRRGNVTVFGAKRGFGKTSYGNMVTRLAIPNLRVAMFAGEDSAMMYGKRFLAARAGLNAMQLRDNHVNAADWSAITRALAEAPQNPFFVRVEGRPVEWIASCIRDVSKEQGLDLVIVDYLQCLRTSHRLQDRRNEVTYVAKTLQDAIKSVNASGLLFSQLKRTERLEPEVEDLKESGDIEDMADHIVLGWKVESPNASPTRWLKLGKNKDGIDPGDLSPFQLTFDNRTASFIENGVPAPDGFCDGF